MATEITIPKLSDTMTEGLFAVWRKQIGDRIERGDIIAEVETDKAVMELESFASGILLRTFVHGGEQVPVGAVLGLIGEAAEMGSDLPETPAAAPRNPEPVTAPPATAAADAVPLQASQLRPEGEPRHDKASPLVRRLAREQGIDLESLRGSGPDGRITQSDLEAGLPLKRTPAPPAGEQGMTAPAAGASSTPAPEAPTSAMRQAITAAVTSSWHSIPHFSVAIEIPMEACREVVAELSASGHPVGYNALLLKACAVTLTRFPLLCSAPPGEKGIHLSFAVALDDGLLMPVLRGCDSLSVTEIGRQAKRLAEKCRQGKLTSEELSGGCFSVSNLGMYGVDDFTALIMPGQVAILAAGSVALRPVVRDGAITAAATMRVTLCSDHRVIDGAYAARFLQDLRSTLEKPVSLLVTEGKA